MINYLRTEIYTILEPHPRTLATSRGVFILGNYITASANLGNAFRPRIIVANRLYLSVLAYGNGLFVSFIFGSAILLRDFRQNGWESIDNRLTIFRPKLSLVFSAGRERKT